MQLSLPWTFRSKALICFFIIIPLILMNTMTITSINHSGEPDSISLFEIPNTKIHPLPMKQSQLVSSQHINHIFGNESMNNTPILPAQHYLIQNHPQIASIQDEILVLALTKQNSSQPTSLTATYSTDQGQSWPESITLSLGNLSFTSPVLDYTGDPEMQAYATNPIDLQTGLQLVYGFPSLSNPEKAFNGSSSDFLIDSWFNGRILIWDLDYWTVIGDSAIAGYYHGSEIAPHENFHGIAFWAGHDGTNWSCYYFCETDEDDDETYKILWKNYVESPILHVDIDIDLVTGWQYDVYEIINQTTDQPEIKLDSIYLEPGNPLWYTDDENYGTSWQLNGFTNPSLKATGGYVYLACEKEGDIYLHRSNDGGDSYITIQVTNSTDNETTPEISANGEFITLLYSSNSNIYSINSNDGGIHWAPPQILNTNQQHVSQTNQSYKVDNHYVVWQNDLENSTIFFENINVSYPLFEITNITGGFSLSANITNSGTVNASNMSYSILISNGFILSNRTFTGTIDLAVGETKTISTDELILGLGSPQLRFQIGSTVKTRSSTLILCYLII